MFSYVNKNNENVKNLLFRYILLIPDLIVIVLRSWFCYGKACYCFFVRLKNNSVALTLSVTSLFGVVFVFFKKYKRLYTAVAVSIGFRLVREVYFVPREMRE